MNLRYSTNKSIIIACIFIWCVLLYFILLTPYMTDNYLFSRDMLPGYAAFISGAPIEQLAPMTFEAALRQAADMYTSWCGRFTGNLVVYLSFLLPYPVYALLAATAFVAYLFLLHICVWGARWRETLNARWLLALGALLWLGMPSFGSAFFWISVGGFYALLGQALFLLPYRFALDQETPTTANPAVQCLLFFAAGLFVALLDYATAAAMPVTALACTVWLYFRQAPKARRIPRMLLAGALGVSLGGALTLLAPGNAERVRLTTDPAVHAYMASSFSDKVISYILHLPQALLLQGVPLILLLWGCWVLYRSHGRRWIAHVPHAALLFLLPAAVTHGAYFFTSWPPPRAFATTTVQFIVAACIMAYAALPTAQAKAQRLLSALRLILAVICLGSLLYESQKFWQVHRAMQHRESVYAAHKGEDVLVPPLHIKGDSYMILGSHLPDISPDPNFWVNRAVAAWHGLKSVAIAMPQYRLIPEAGQSEHIPLEAVTNSFSIQVDYTPPASTSSVDSLYIYYYAKSSLLHKLPQAVADPIFNWLEKGNFRDFRLLLVPLLCTRADIKLDWSDGEAGHGESMLWGMYPIKSNMWLVSPGEGKLSFNLIPLKIAQEDLFPNYSNHIPEKNHPTQESEK